MEAVIINTRWCKGCGICVAFCPQKALKLEDGKSVPLPDLCVACGMCELYCPDLAVTVNTDKKKPKPAGTARSNAPGKVSGRAKSKAMEAV